MTIEMTRSEAEARASMGDNDFQAAITMAEAASCGNVSWWNQARIKADDPARAEYMTSALLGQLISDSAHRNGMTVADVWSFIRRTGCLPE